MWKTVVILMVLTPCKPQLMSVLLSYSLTKRLKSNNNNRKTQNKAVQKCTTVQCICVFKIFQVYKVIK